MLSFLLNKRIHLCENTLKMEHRYLFTVSVDVVFGDTERLKLTNK